MHKQKFNYLLCLISIFSILCGTTYAYESNLNYLYFIASENSSEDHQIAYEIKNSNFEDELIFNLELSHDDEISIYCPKTINFNSNELYKKISCTIPQNLGDGKYIFTAKLFIGYDLIDACN